MEASRPNLLFVCIDCLRQDFTTGEHATTPFLDAFRDDALAYDRLFSTTTTTTPSVASLLTGTYSEHNGINSLNQCSLNADVRTLAECFSEAGYKTSALVTGPLVEETGLDRGFDHYSYREKDEALVGDWAETAFDHLETLADGEPFCLYLHLWELHTPIDVPPEFDAPRYGDTPYARMLSALDPALEAFVEAAPENTVVVVHGDHGESITWRESRVHYLVKRLRDAVRYEAGVDTRWLEQRLNRVMDRFAPSYPDHYLEDSHGETFFDFVSNVPMLLRGPGIDPNTVDAQCRQVDVLPTLVDLFDLDRIADTDGTSLLPADEVTDRPAYLRACGASLRDEANWQRGIRADGYKYVEYPNRDWPPELYDLDTDPKELYDLAHERPQKLREMRNLLPREELMQVDRLDIDDRLRDLGYM